MQISWGFLVLETPGEMCHHEPESYPEYTQTHFSYQRFKWKIKTQKESIKKKEKVILPVQITWLENLLIFYFAYAKRLR